MREVLGQSAGLKVGELKSRLHGVCRGCRQCSQALGHFEGEEAMSSEDLGRSKKLKAGGESAEGLKGAQRVRRGVKRLGRL